MHKLRKIALWIIGILVIHHIVLWSTGNLHFYKTLSDTIFKGRLGPSIYEYDLYYNRAIEAGTHQEWQKHTSYNKTEVAAPLRKSMEDLGTVSLVVIKNGELLYEEYWEGYSDSSKTNSWSMAKSHISMLIGVAISEGKISSVNDKVWKYLPEFKEGKNAELTIKHLLNMSSGIDFGEHYLNPFGFMAKALYGDEIKELTLEHAVSYEPGTKWHYQGGNNILLGLILREATGKTPSEYFSEKVWKKVGAKHDALWSLDKEGGYEKGYCCVFSNAKDFARLGQLMLQKGNWNGQQIIDSSYIETSIQPININDRFGDIADHYGYAWWLMNYKGHEIFYARGINGQYTLVIPDEDMVVVRLGHKRIKEKGAKHPKDVYFYLDAALEMIENT